VIEICAKDLDRCAGAFAGAYPDAPGLSLLLIAVAVVLIAGTWPREKGR